MIEIRVLITDQIDTLNIQITSGSNILTEYYFKKRKDMDIKCYIRHMTRNSFDHALEVCLDHWEVKIPESLGEGGD